MTIARALRSRLPGGLLSLLLAACTPHAHDQDYAKMNPIPLQTYCVGRLLVDLPKQATFSWTQEFDDSKVSRLPSDINTPERFWNLVEKRRDELAAAPHDTEGHLLYRFDNPSTVSAIVLFRESNTDVYGYNIERYLWTGHWGHLFKSGIANSDKGNLDHLVNTFNRLIPIDNRMNPPMAPQQAGFCIDGALVTGEVGRISAGPTLYMFGMKGVSISVNAVENFPPSSDPALNSAYGGVEDKQRQIRMTREQIPGWSSDPDSPKDFIVLRKREHSLHGIPGQEVVYRQIFNNDKRSYRFLWLDTQRSNNRLPSAGVQMDFTDEQDPAKPALPLPPEDQMFALWDAVLSSVRLRPGAY